MQIFMFMELLEILKYTLPSLIAFLTAYLLVGSMLKHDEKRRRFEMIIQNQKFITPIRLQAYERITILLERISPESLVMRLNEPTATCQQLQADLLAAIRAEFEHNFSQQIYLSPEAWEIIKVAKNNTIKLINLAADRVEDNAPSIQLSRTILEMMMESEQSPVAGAIAFLKKEMQQFF